LNASAITALGVLGDRAFALVDEETGKIVQCEKSTKVAELFIIEQAYAERRPARTNLPPIWITLPDGALVRSDDPQRDQALPLRSKEK